MAAGVRSAGSHVKPKHMTSQPVRAKESVTTSHASGASVSSASTQSSTSPVARSIPALRAAPAPAFLWWMTHRRASRAAHSSRMRDEPSVEPSSTQMTSTSRMVCPSTDARHALR